MLHTTSHPPLPNTPTMRHVKKTSSVTVPVFQRDIGREIGSFPPNFPHGAATAHAGPERVLTSTGTIARTEVHDEHTETAEASTAAGSVGIDTLHASGGGLAAIRRRDVVSAAGLDPVSVAADGGPVGAAGAGRVVNARLDPARLDHSADAVYQHTIRLDIACCAVATLRGEREYLSQTVGWTRIVSDIPGALLALSDDRIAAHADWYAGCRGWRALATKHRDALRYQQAERDIMARGVAHIISETV